MKIDPKKHNRRSIRWEGYDYSLNSYYFVTLCTYRMRRLFGRVRNSEMELTALGSIIQTEWLRTSQIRREVALDKFMVMPNLFYAIVLISRGMPAQAVACRKGWRAHCCVR